MHLPLIFFASLLTMPGIKSISQENDRILTDQHIESIFSGINNTKSPGIAVSIIQDGKVISRKAFGMASIEHAAAFTHQTPVRLGYSGAREFFCAGLALMEMEGLLSFDDKVRDYFPKLPAWSSQVTIQDLLNHSSGFDDEWATMLLMQASMDNRVDKEQLLTLLYNQPRPQVEPGKGYMYSNSDFALLRFIMEIVSKKTLPTYLNEAIFSKLGMSSTFMNDDLGQLIPGLAVNYVGAGNYRKLIGIKTSPGGNYRIVTSAEDLEKWALALEDSNSFVSNAYQRLQRNARPIPVFSPEKHYLFGHEWRKINQTEIIKHGGVNGDFYMTRIPSKRMTIIGLGNSMNNMRTAMSLVNYILGDEEKAVVSKPDLPTHPAKPTMKEMENYAGRYFEQNQPGHSSYIPRITFYDIKAEGDSLNFYYASNAFFKMEPVGDGLFKDIEYDALIQFSRPHPDSGMLMKIWLPDGDQMNLKKGNSMVHASPEYLRQFTGEYHSRHLDFYCRIAFNEEGGLVIRRATISDKLLIPDGKDRFLFEMQDGDAGWYVVAEFTRDKKGKVDGINMQHVRMMHHRFEKVR